MNIERFIVGPFEVNSYILFSSATTEALVIDPGADAARLLHFLREHRLHPLAYLLTHGHVDHVSALAALHRAFPAPVALHPLDARWAFTEISQIPPYYPAPEAPSELHRTLRAVADAQEWQDGPFRYRVIATPGHTPGGVSFYFYPDSLLFSGDTLFQGSVGRTDIPGGDSRALARSLARLAALPDDTRVYPGHGKDTTIGIEKRTNFFLRNSAS